MDDTTQPHDDIAQAERGIVEALGGVDSLLDPSGPGGSGSTLRMIVAERQVRELARRARDDLLEVLGGCPLPPAAQRVSASLLHVSHVVGVMCDEYVDLSRLHGLDTVSDTHIVAALRTMRDLSREQVRNAATALAHRDTALASSLRPAHAAIEALNHQVGDRGLVADDGAVGHVPLGSAVLVAECLMRISEQAVDVGDQVLLLAGGSHPRQSPV